MTCMFTMEGLFFVALHGCDAKALAPQLHLDVSGRGAYILPVAHRLAGILLISANPQRFDPALHLGEHHHFAPRQLCQQTTKCDTHPRERGNKRSAISRKITVVLFFFFVTPGMCYVQQTHRGPITVEGEQSCGCDTVRYAATISVGNVLGGIRRGGDRSHDCLLMGCVFFPSTLVCRRDRKLDVDAIVEKTEHAENVKGIMQS